MNTETTGLELLCTLPHCHSVGNAYFDVSEQILKLRLSSFSKHFTLKGIINYFYIIQRETYYSMRVLLRYNFPIKILHSSIHEHDK